MMEKNIRMGDLLSVYGELLPEKQRSLIDLACNEDLSLSEISENTGITRQGVHDSIRRGEGQLEAYESALHLLQKNEQSREQLARLQALLEQAKGLLSEQDAAKRLIDDACKMVVSMLQKEE